MSLKSSLSKVLAAIAVRRVRKLDRKARDIQKQTLEKLLSDAASTSFGRDHQFSGIDSYESFKAKVPVRDYEALKNYLDRVIAGEENVLWPGKPVYLSKTSGTTSGAKYIPISKESMGHHIEAARNALLFYIHETGNAKFVDGKMIFLQGSPTLSLKNGIQTGRLSGIVAHHVPSYLQKNRLPSFETNCIEDWEKKVEAIIDETIDQPMSLISGIPSWVQFYFERLLERSGKSTISELFPKFDLFVYGGVNFQPYASRFRELIGKEIDSIETYPASEGFIAYQDRQGSKELLLNVNAGIFFEFIPADEYFNETPPRLQLSEIELDVNYALILSTNAGLWAYSIGDTVKFTSKDPYRIVVTGRIKHFTSAFGEQGISEEVESALRETLQEFPETQVIEFTVAPQLNPSSGLPHHEWFISFASPPENISEFEMELDSRMKKKNIYYADLINGSILRPLRIRSLNKNAFNDYMKSQGKLGGQNKVPRLSNDRAIADQLMTWVV